MKSKNSKKIIILIFTLLIIFSLKGCYKYEKEKHNKVAVVMPKAGYEQVLEGFKEALNESSFNNNIQLIIQNFGSNKEDFITASKNVSGLDVNLIFTITTPATIAVYENVKNKPIVFAAVGDPIGAGFAESMKKPKENITGVTNLSRELTKKRFEVFYLAFPHIKKVLTFYNPENVYSVLAIKDLLEITDKLNIKLDALESFDAESIKKHLKKIKKGSYDGVFIIPDPVVLSVFTNIIEFSNELAVPVCVHEPRLVEKGATISYGVDLKNVGRLSFFLIEQVLKGVKPEKIPIFVPEKVSLVINNKWAKEKGYIIPNELLYIADKVLE